MTTINPTARPLPSAMRHSGSTGAGGGAASAAATIPLDPVRLLRTYKWWLIFAAIVGGGLGVLAYFLMARYAPTYRSTVIYVVLEPKTQLLASDSPQVDKEEYERYAATQARTLTSDVVLTRIFDEPRLRDRFANTKWGKAVLEDAKENKRLVVRELQQAASARPITGTRFMELRVSGADPRDVQVLGDLIHIAYFQHMDFEAARRTTAQLAPLKGLVDSLGEQMVQNQKDQLSLVENKKLTSLDDISNPVRGDVSRVETTLSELQGQVLPGLEVQVKRLQSQQADEGGVSYTEEQIELGERDPIVLNQKTLIADLERELAANEAIGILRSHPNQIRLTERLRATQSQLEAARRDAREKIFQADLARTQERISAVKAQVESLEKQRVELQRRSNEISLAQAELSILKATRVNLADRQAIAQKDLRNAEALAASVRQGEIRDLFSNIVAVAQRDRVLLIKTAEQPDSPSFPSLRMFVPLGVVMLGGLTLGLVVLRELLDQRVRGPADLSMIPRARLLGIIPLASEDPMKPASVETAFKDSPTGAVSEGYRQVRTQIARAMQNAGYRSLLVVAGAPEAGATSTAANLAMGMAASELRVLVIDANFRRPAMHRVFKLAEGPGLGDVLARQKTLEQAVQATSVANVSLLSAGSASMRAVPERLSTESMTQLVEQATKLYDMVIIDTAPAMVAGDAVALANRCDASLLVVRAMSEKRGLVSRLGAQLSECRAEYLGVVITHVRASAGGYMRKNIKAAYDYQNSGQPAA